MSRATIEQSLNGLVPTLNGVLPQELVEIALSLLTQSRGIANSLKADEEIARPYACAHLACDRLKKRLNLPSLTPRPPCPPRIYKKLYKYLESTLPAAAPREPQTPRKDAAKSAPPSARTTPKTPKTPMSATRTPRSTRKVEHTAQEAPDWVMPTIRIVLKAFAYPNAAPHIFTGIVSILPLLARMSAAAAETPGKRPRRAVAAPQTSAADVSDARMLGLLAVLLLYVLSRMLDQDISPEQDSEWQGKAVAALLESAAGKDVSEADLVSEIQYLMPLAAEEGWLQMGWFSNVKPADDGEEMEGVETTNGNRAMMSQGKGMIGNSDYIGLGTMMQDATDYLGVRQREEYKEWKAGIMARVEEIEAS
ncbi:hypothetical protein P280DRAFT_406143 [Massarina eburnea CBS 473.64]|uniref:ORC6 first cyclin-like domain-containing protein n=1 Tax=Massarina eburnea CBS 473.64 TaxID=1395130 RepID=A0A6A6RS24_9PLEO|nr:hypothetical protein P280DRAFT_406143 [Massarina eburnea CBS 473.64]